MFTVLLKSSVFIMEERMPNPLTTPVSPLIPRPSPAHAPLMWPLRHRRAGPRSRTPPVGGPRSTGIIRARSADLEETGLHELRQAPPTRSPPALGVTCVPRQVPNPPDLRTPPAPLPTCTQAPHSTPPHFIPGSQSSSGSLTKPRIGTLTRNMTDAALGSWIQSQPAYLGERVQGSPPQWQLSDTSPEFTLL